MTENKILKWDYCAKVFLSFVMLQYTKPIVKVTMSQYIRPPKKWHMPPDAIFKLKVAYFYH